MSAANTLVRSKFGNLLEKWLNEVSMRGWKDSPDEYKGAYKTKTADGYNVRIQDIRGFGMAQEVRENTEIPMWNTSQGYVNEALIRKFGGGFRFSEELREDNRYLDLGPFWAKHAGVAAKETREWEAVKPFNNGHSTYKMPDGENWFSNAHKGVGGITLENQLSTPAEFSEDTLESLYILCKDQKSDTNILSKLMGVGLVASHKIEYDVCRIMDSPMQPNTFSNNINAPIKVNGKASRVFLRRLVHPGRVFMKTNDERSAAMYNRRKWRMRMEADKVTETIYNIGSERYVPFIESWSCYVSNGAVV